MSKRFTADEFEREAKNFDASVSKGNFLLVGLGDMFRQAASDLRAEPVAWTRQLYIDEGCGHFECVRKPRSDFETPLFTREPQEQGHVAVTKGAVTDGGVK